jgi:CBS domain-containing protein
VGALLVSNGRRLAGIVTDRDLVCEVMAAGLDPAMTLLGDVMSEDVATVDIGADIPTVVALMSKHACRRVPIMEHGAVAGVVTLDDLLLEGAIDAKTAGDIIRAQLEKPARYKRAGAVHPEGIARQDFHPRGARAVTRRSARAAAAYARLLETVERRTGIHERARAELALKVVLASICRRVTPDEARHFIAQLPSILKEQIGAHLNGPDRQITRASIDEELAAVLSVSLQDVTEIATGVAEALAESISAGQLQTMKGQLPGELKDLFPVWGASLRNAS